MRQTDKFITIKIRQEDHKKLRILAADRDMKLWQVVAAAIARFGKPKKAKQ